MISWDTWTIDKALFWNSLKGEQNLIHGIWTEHRLNRWLCLSVESLYFRVLSVVLGPRILQQPSKKLGEQKGWVRLTPKQAAEKNVMCYAPMLSVTLRSHITLGGERCRWSICSICAKNFGAVIISSTYWGYLNILRFNAAAEQGELSLLKTCHQWLWHITVMCTQLIRRWTTSMANRWAHNLQTQCKPTKCLYICMLRYLWSLWIYYCVKYQCPSTSQSVGSTECPSSSGTLGIPSRGPLQSLPGYSQRFNTCAGDHWPPLTTY